MHLRYFSQGQGTEWGYFLGVVKISNVFLGCLKLLTFVWGEQLMLGPSLRMKKQ